MQLKSIQQAYQFKEVVSKITNLIQEKVNELTRFYTKTLGIRFHLVVWIVNG